MNTPTVFPAPLRPGDLIRFVSPASAPSRDDVEWSADLLRGMGYAVDCGRNAFNKLNYLAGTDDERLADLDEAMRDPKVRAIFATKGGKGSFVSPTGSISLLPGATRSSSWGSPTSPRSTWRCCGMGQRARCPARRCAR